MLLVALAILCAAPVEAPSAETLTKRSAATKRLVEEKGARWTMRRALGKSADLGVRVTKFGDDLSWEFLFFKGDEVTVMRTVTAFSDVHVDARPGRPPVVARAFEEVLPDASWWVLLQRAGLSYFKANGGEILLSDDGKISRWNSPTVPARDGGVVVSVDDATGVVLHANVSEERGTFISDFTLLDVRPAELVRPKVEVPKPLTAEAMKHTVAWGLVQGWRPGGAEGEADTVLVNEDAQDLRRVPNSLGPSFQLTFLSPLKAVVITPDLSGRFLPVVVDLVSGESRWLGDWPPGTVCLFPRASADGRRVLLSVGIGTQSQLVVVDVATGVAKPIGAPMDQTYASWLTADSLLVMRRDAQNQRRIVKVGLDGKERLVRANATNPVVLRDGKRFLFRDTESREWRLAGLDGKGEQRVGDGLVKAFDPAAGDGALLFLEQLPDQQLGRVYVDLTSGEVIRAPTVGPGRWATPVFP